MAKVEIEEGELTALQAAYKTLNGMYKKDKRGTEKLMKDTFGDKVTTSEDEAKPFLDEIRAEIKPIKEFMETIGTKQKDWEQNQAFNQLRNQGYTEEGIEAIKKLMTEEGIKNPIHAAAVFDKMNPPKPAAPNGLQSSAWNFGAASADDADLKELMTDEEAWADKEAIKVFGEIKQGKAG